MLLLNISLCRSEEQIFSHHKIDSQFNSNINQCRKSRYCCHCHFNFNTNPITNYTCNSIEKCRQGLISCSISWPILGTAFSFYTAPSFFTFQFLESSILRQLGFVLKCCTVASSNNKYLHKIPIISCKSCDCFAWLQYFHHFISILVLFVFAFFGGVIFNDIK